VAAGDNACGQCDTEDLKHVAALAPGLWSLAALHTDGTISYLGNASYQQDLVSRYSCLDVEPYQKECSLSRGSQAEPEVVSGLSGEEGPWLYLSHDLCIEITLTYYEDCRSRFYIAHLFTPDADEQILDGLWNERNGASVTSPPRLAQKFKAVYGQNCNYFTDPENDGRGPDIRNGVVYKRTMGRDFFYFDTDGNMVTCITKDAGMDFEDLQATGTQHVYGFGPVLMQSGELLSEDYYRRESLYGNNPRSAFGMVENGHYVGMVVDGRKPGISAGVTTYRLAQQFAAEGCAEAYNLDGGQSAAMLLLGVQITNHRNESMFNGQRAIPDLLIFGTSDLCAQD